MMAEASWCPHQGWAARACCPNSAGIQHLTRAVLFCGVDFKVARHVVGASQHFQFVAHTVIVGIIDAAVTIVELSWENAIGITFRSLVIVARQRIVAARASNGECQGHSRSIERFLVDIPELKVDQRLRGARSRDVGKPAVDGVPLPICACTMKMEPPMKVLTTKSPPVQMRSTLDQCSVVAVGIAGHELQWSTKCRTQGWETRKEERIDRTSKSPPSGS